MHERVNDYIKHNFPQTSEAPVYYRLLTELLAHLGSIQMSKMVLFANIG